MKKLILCSGISFVLMALAGCSQNQLNQFQRQLSDVSTMISPGEQHPSEKEAERNEIAQAFSLPVGVDTAALRLKQHYGFPSDEDVSEQETMVREMLAGQHRQFQKVPVGQPNLGLIIA